MGVRLHKFASACTLYVKHRDDSKAGAAVARKVCRLTVIDSLWQSCQVDAGSCWVSPSSAMGVGGVGLCPMEVVGSTGGLVLSLWGCNANKPTSESALGGNPVLYVRAVECKTADRKTSFTVVSPPLPTRGEIMFRCNDKGWDTSKT